MRSTLVRAVLAMSALSLTLAGCSSSETPASSSAAPATSAAAPASSAAAVEEKIRVKVTLLVMGSSSIDSGTEVRLTDGSGNLLGFGNFTDCPGCSASFGAKKTTDGFYQLTVGGLPSVLSYTDDDVVGGVLTVMASV